MGETQPITQTTMLTKSSIKRKPLADLTNIVRKPNRNKPGSSNASDSSIGSTQNPIKPHRLKPDHLAVDENQTAQARKHSTKNTKSKAKAAVPSNQSSFQERSNDVKEGSVSLSSSTLDKIKNHEKVNQSCLGKTVNDGKKIYVAPNDSSTEKVKDKRKSIDVPLSPHHMKKANNSTNIPNRHSTEKLKDKGKENVVESGYSLTGNANSSMGGTMPGSLVKSKDKGKAIAEPIDYPSRKKLKNNMMEFSVPLKGVVIKEREGTVTGSGNVNLAQKDKGKGVSLPITYHTLEKKDQQSSCPPIIRAKSNRSDAGGTEDVLKSKLQTEPPPNKKKKRCLTKEVKEEYTLPQDYVEQQRAYFKEIDDFELLVEEV